MCRQRNANSKPLCDDSVGKSCVDFCHVDRSNGATCHISVCTVHVLYMHCKYIEFYCSRVSV